MSTIKPREAEIVIYQGDDLARLADLRRTAEAATRAGAGNSLRVGDDGAGQAERDAYDAFVDEAAERAVVVKVRAIGRKRFRDLMAEHPPRKVDGEDGPETHEDDAPYDVNTDSFPEALLAFRDGDVSTIVSPEFGTSAAARDFLENDIADGDFESLWVGAYFLNRAPSADPKASRFSTGSPRLNET